jgi:hypothetical protein
MGLAGGGMTLSAAMLHCGNTTKLLKKRYFAGLSTAVDN